MKTNITKLALLSLTLFPFAGCESTSTQKEEVESAVRLDGSKFDFGNRVRRTIHFEGTKGTLNSDAVEGGVRIDFSRYQSFDEYDPEFESGRKVRTRYQIVDDHTWTRVELQKEQYENTKTSPLRGYTIIGRHDGVAWSHSLNFRSSDPFLQEELDDFIYHKRASYPEGDIEVGSTWTHSPLLMNAYLRRDLKNVMGSVTLTLTAVEYINGERSAIIALELESLGDEVHDSGMVSQASITLSGEIVLSLETYLETKIDLEGEMSGSIVTDGQLTAFTAPITIVASEIFVEEEDLEF